MLDLIANWLLGIIFKKGDATMMAMLYASKIVMEATNPKTGRPWDFNDVPNKLKQQVADILVNECGLPELVPEEYGGTRK